MNPTILQRIKSDLIQKKEFSENQDYAIMGVLEKVSWVEKPFESKYEIIFNFKLLNGGSSKIIQTFTSKPSKIVQDGADKLQYKLDVNMVYIYKKAIFMEAGKGISINTDVLRNLMDSVIYKKGTKYELSQSDIINKFGASVKGFNDMRMIIREYVKEIHNNYLGYTALISSKFIDKKYVRETLRLNNAALAAGVESDDKTNYEKFISLMEKEPDKISDKIDKVHNSKTLFNTDGKITYVYDIEVFKEFFGVVFRKFDLETFTFDERDKIEFKSTDENYLEKLCEFLDKIHILVGFNNFDYDDIIFGNLIYNYVKNKVDLNNIRIDYLGEKVSALFIMSNEKIKTKGLESTKTYYAGTDGMVEAYPKIFSLDLKTGLAPNVSLKEIEANLGADIEETSVEFDKSGTLSEEEIESIMKYCAYDVLMSCRTFIERKDEFVGIMQLVKTFELDEKFVRRTKATITTEILKCLGKINGLDDFDFTYTSYIDKMFNKDLDYFLEDDTLNKLKTEINILSNNNLSDGEKKQLLEKLKVKQEIELNYFGILPNGSCLFEKPLTTKKDLDVKWNVMRKIMLFYEEIKTDGNALSEILYSRHRFLNNSDILVKIDNMLALYRKYGLDKSKSFHKLLRTQYEIEGTDEEIFINCLKDYVFNSKRIYSPISVSILDIIYENFKTALSNKHLKLIVDGNEVKLAFGGLHCALENLYYDNSMFSVDVASYYPSLMDKHNFFTRSSINGNADFVAIKEQRLVMKRAKNPLQQVYKIAINSTYGVQKASTSAAFDPVQANNICINGQIGLVDLIMRLSSFTKMIQANTDGVVVAFKTTRDGNGTLVEDANYFFQKDRLEKVYHNWENSYELELELDVFNKIKQTNVNNYIVAYNKKYGDDIIIGTKEKGAGFGNNKIDKIIFDKNQLRILRIFEKELFLNNIEPSQVIDNILESNDVDLTMFQILAKTSKAYPELRFTNYKGEIEYVKTKVNRIFPIRTIKTVNEIGNTTVEVMTNGLLCGYLVRVKYTDKEVYLESLNSAMLDAEPLLNTPKDTPDYDKIVQPYYQLKKEYEEALKKDEKEFYVTSKVTNASDYSFIFNSNCRHMSKADVLKLNIDFNYYLDMFKETQKENNYILINTYHNLCKYIDEINKKGLWYVQESDAMIQCLKTVNKRAKDYYKLEKLISKSNPILEMFKTTNFKKIFTLNNVDILDNIITEFEILKDISVISKNAMFEILEIKSGYLNVYDNLLFKRLEDMEKISEEIYNQLLEYKRLILELGTLNIKSLTNKVSLKKISQNDVLFDKTILETIEHKKVADISKKYIVADLNKVMNVINNTMLNRLLPLLSDNKLKSSVEDILARIVITMKYSNTSVLEILRENNINIRKYIRDKQKIDKNKETEIKE